VSYWKHFACHYSFKVESIQSIKNTSFIFFIFSLCYSFSNLSIIYYSSFNSMSMESVLDGLPILWQPYVCLPQWYTSAPMVYFSSERLKVYRRFTSANPIWPTCITYITVWPASVEGTAASSSSHVLVLKRRQHLSTSSHSHTIPLILISFLVACRY
jgi:hypothetical protein